MKKLCIITLALILLTACATAVDPTQEQTRDEPVNTGEQSLPNPASLYCEEHGGIVEIRTAIDGSQAGACVFPDGSECDEWAYYRGECAPGKDATEEPTATSLVDQAASPTEISTAVSIDPAGYEGWETYVHPEFHFSFLYPPDWSIEDTTTGESTLAGHILNIHPNEGAGQGNIRMTFREVGDSLLLWPTGVGQGEFITQGALDVGGQPVQRMLLNCPTGEVTSIYYHPNPETPNILMGNLEFAFIYQASSTHCEAGYSLGGKVQNTGEMIIASLQVP